MAREEGKRIGIKLIESHVSSVNDLQRELQKLNTKTRMRFSITPDPMVGSQSQLIIDTAKAKKLATMFQEQSLVANGASPAMAELS
jgi:ABC-type uncharacterized transport system substrate-binding protein